MATTTHEHMGFGGGRRLLSELSAGMGSETLVAAGAVVLAIIGLAGIEAIYMVAIATIAVGAALLLEGGVLMAKQMELNGEGAVARTGVSSQFLGGAAGVVLGILALVGIHAMTLMSIALIAFGASLLVGVPLTSTLRSQSFRTAVEPSATRTMGREATLATSGAEALVALAAIVLGILALVNFAPLTLTLVGMLVLGASILLNGAAMTTWMLAVRR